MNELSDLMEKHGISVWVDPYWLDGSHGTPRWLAGTSIRAEEGRQYSTLTGADAAEIAADNIASGDTPVEAVKACAARLNTAT